MSEIPGQGHWWQGIVDDAEMQAFIDDHASRAPAPPATANSPSFVVTTIAGWGTGRGGLKIIQVSTPAMDRTTLLIAPGSARVCACTQVAAPRRLAQLRVTLSPSSPASMATRNVLRFGVTRTDLLGGGECCAAC